MATVLDGAREVLVPAARGNRPAAGHHFMPRRAALPPQAACHGAVREVRAQNGMLGLNTQDGGLNEGFARFSYHPPGPVTRPMSRLIPTAPIKNHAADQSDCREECF